MLKQFLWFFSAVVFGVIAAGGSVAQQGASIFFFTMGWMICYYWGPPNKASSGQEPESHREMDNG